MNDRTFIVTGANTGIGKEIAEKLARPVNHVVMVSRDPDKGRAALEDIKMKSPGSRADLVTGDLGTIRSVKELASKIISDFPSTAVLINNAGTWPRKPEINPDGLEQAFMVNHMAPFILSTMLSGLLMKNKPARIVNVNAGLYVFGRIDLEKTPYGKDFGMLKTYMNTKLCNILFTQKFAEIYEGRGIAINAVHPGVIRTNLGAGKGMAGRLLRLLKTGLDSPEKGAGPPVWLATAAELENITGKYFDLFKQKPFAPNACDEGLKNRLWELSMKLAALDMPGVV